MVVEERRKKSRIDDRLDCGMSRASLLVATSRVGLSDALCVFCHVELSLRRRMNLVRNFALGVTTATLARYTWNSVSDVRYPSSYAVCTTGNGTIYTVDETNPTAECISVKDGRLVAIGSKGESLLN